MAVCRVWGCGLLGRAAKTESSSILAWRLPAPPLGMGHLHRVTSHSHPAEQVLWYRAGRWHFLDVTVEWLSPRSPKAHQQCGGYLLLCTYLDEVRSCLESPLWQALAGSC